MKLIPQLKGKILLAFSGGPDSVVLLDLFLKEGYEVELFHLDHNLRENSKDDARFCANLAKEKKLLLHSYSLDVEEYCREKGLGIEEGARNLRYDLLRKIKKERNLDYIATAHHLDDQMETFFMNLFRGSGTAGLGGIHPVKGDLYRPLLSFRKEEIMEYAKKNKLAYVIDQTNLEPIYSRNRLRLDLIPKIEEEYAPNLSKRLLTSMEILREENAFINELLDEKIDWDKELYGVEEIRQLHPVLKKAFIRRKFSLNYAQTQEAMDILEERSRGEKHFSEGLLRREQDFFYIGPYIKKPSVSHKLLLGTNELEGYTFEIRSAQKPLFTENTHSIPEELLEEPLVLRHRRPGDMFQPSGLQGKKKLKDYFIDEKIPRSQRDKYWLLASAETVFWIIGLRKAQISTTAQNYLQIFIEK